MTNIVRIFERIFERIFAVFEKNENYQTTCVTKTVFLKIINKVAITEFATGCLQQ